MESAMGGAPSPSSATVGDFTWTIAGILGLLIIIVLTIIPLTLVIIQNREADAVLIDMAGQQRMLLEHHLEEIILASQGVDTQYVRTRTVLRERLRSLIHGGSISPLFDFETAVSVPMAPTDDIRARFIEQQSLLESLVVESDRFIQTPMNQVQQKQAREALLIHNAKLVETANHAVILLTQHSSMRLQQLIHWEIVAVSLVVMIASIRTWRFLQAEKALRTSQKATLEALRQNDVLKSALVSSVSHDLRTPLTAIKTLLYSLGDDAAVHPDGVRKELVLKIDQEIDYLDRTRSDGISCSSINIVAVDWYVGGQRKATVRETISTPNPVRRISFRRREKATT